jgi:hypothetical protein
MQPAVPFQQSREGFPDKIEHGVAIMQKPYHGGK